MKSGIFITGTDTDIGKTFVTAALVAKYKKEKIDVGVYKPLQSGATRRQIKKTKQKRNVDVALLLESPDLEFIKKHTKLALKKTKCSVMLEAPLAPQQAAVVDKAPHIKPKDLIKDYKSFSAGNELTLVEGAGGLFVPIKKEYLMIDLIKDLKLPVIITSRPNLGTINHTCLTIEALKKRKIKILGVIYTETKPLDKKDISPKLNPKVIEDITGVKCLGYIPFQKKIDFAKINFIQ